MKHQIAFNAAGILMLAACQNSANDISSEVKQSEAEIADCVRNIMKLDEGTWAYMGTIARGNGMFRTYATTSEHKAVGPDMWSFRSYGGYF